MKVSTSTSYEITPAKKNILRLGLIMRVRKQTFKNFEM